MENIIIQGTSLYGVPLATATAAIADLEQLVPTPTRAFTVHAYDLLGALGYDAKEIGQIAAAYPLPNKHARLYLGAIHAATGPELKLYLVPVKDANINPPGSILAGTDQIPSGAYQEYANQPIQYGDFVYDLIAPCPGTCDITSPMYLAGI